MKNQTMLIAGIFVVVVIIGAYLLLNAPGPYDSFAKCLSDKGVKMYGAFWCPHCKEEKALFQSSFKYVNYVECSNQDGSQTQVCADAGIQSYPTWQFANGTKQSGVLPLDQLSQMTGCPLTAKT